MIEKQVVLLRQVNAGKNTNTRFALRMEITSDLYRSACPQTLEFQTC